MDSFLDVEVARMRQKYSSDSGSGGFPSLGVGLLWPLTGKEIKG